MLTFQLLQFIDLSTFSSPNNLMKAIKLQYAIYYNDIHEHLGISHTNTMQYKIIARR